ncbi:MAG: nucleoside:proton symporter [Desulfobacteraceae bacterium]|nr:MAG: nucleoside:proton symporter [Desulfobacteraceae bacterium]
MEKIQSITGILVLALIAWIISENRRDVKWRTVATGILLQFALALLLIKAPGAQWIFLFLNKAVSALEEATRAGTSFVFGYLGGGAVPFEEKVPAARYVMAFQSLPLLLVISALSSLLFYWRILPLVVKGFSFLLTRTMALGGVEAFGTAANIFVGMVEAPLMVKPYLSMVSRSEIFTIMTAGMATVAGTVMVIYASILKDVIPGAIAHLIVASIISAPAAITVAKLMVPETMPVSSGRISVPRGAESSMDAITRGTLDGMKLLLGITAMLVVLVALVHLINLVLGLLPNLAGRPVTFQGLLGYILAPITWLMGIPWSESITAGALMGTKTVINEFIAYLDLASIPPEALHPRSRLIMTYALCGFANFGSLGIMIGGMGSMVPEKRGEIATLGIKSILSGTITTCMTGAVVGIIV